MKLQNELFNKVLNIPKIKNQKPKITENYIQLRCFTGTHNDIHPSMFIYANGKIICYGCGYKGHINELDNSLIQTSTRISSHLLKEKIETISNIKLNPVILPDNLKLISFPYKNISLETLHRYNVKEFDKWIIVPIYLFNICAGYYYTDGTLKLHSKEKALWGTHFSNYIYPLHHDKYIILVEGIFDALALIDNGFNAGAIFGTGILKNTEKLQMKLFSLLSANIEKVYLWFDNDPPGLIAQEEFYNFLKKFIDTELIYFPYKGDPDELIQIKNIKKELSIKIKGENYAKKMHRLSVTQKCT